MKIAEQRERGNMSVCLYAEMGTKTLAREVLQKKIYNLLVENIDRASLIEYSMEFLRNMQKQGPLDLVCLRTYMQNRMESKIFEMLGKPSYVYNIQAVKNSDSSEVYRSDSLVVEELSNEDFGSSSDAIDTPSRFHSRWQQRSSIMLSRSKVQRSDISFAFDEDDGKVSNPLLIFGCPVTEGFVPDLVVFAPDLSVHGSDRGVCVLDLEDLALDLGEDLEPGKREFVTMEKVLA